MSSYHKYQLKEECINRKHLVKEVETIVEASIGFTNK